MSVACVCLSMSIDEASTTRQAAKARRKDVLDELSETIEAEFDSVVNVQVDDATRSWDSATLFVQLECEHTCVYPNPTHKRSAYEIDANLNSLAPRLYTMVRSAEGVSSMHILDRPNSFSGTRRENLYNRDHYFLDVQLP